MASVDELLRKIAHELPMSIFDVLRERVRQEQVEGYTPEHDDLHDRGQLAKAAACYAWPRKISDDDLLPQGWPWERYWWKPSTPRRNLVKAAALIIAEIDRLDRIRLSKLETPHAKDS